MLASTIGKLPTFFLNFIVHTLVPGNTDDTIGPEPAPSTVLLFTLNDAPEGLVASGLT